MMAGFFSGSIGRRGALTLVGALAGMALALTLTLSPLSAQQEPSSSVRPPPGASIPGGPNVVQPERPGNYDVEMWKKVREGLSGQVSIPDKKAGQLVQSDGEAGATSATGRCRATALWAHARHDRRARRLLPDPRPHPHRARRAGRHHDRASTRSSASATGCSRRSFIILALTGLNVLYGRYVAAAADRRRSLFLHLARGKWLHNYVAFAFMVGLALTFVVWIRHNLPHWRDVVWLLKGGGMFVKGSHPPAWKFNAGQKILFWLVMLGGVSMSLSGSALMFPFQTALFAKTLRW